ncbi:MAG TPA: TAXI family TRAP transporter solute-binding subunit [Opitutaceae bacterium]|nr:TAXI family TRAP transporter solute-binding subunit [Opitutaceae bacterium]
MQPVNAKPRPALVAALIETFGFSPWFATLVAGFLLFLGAAALVWLWLSAPPRTLTITSGPPGSSFQRNADLYKKKLAEHGVALNILPSGGSLDNLKRLQSDSGVDVGFVQGGVKGESNTTNLVSLGSVSHQPIWIFYRGAKPIALLSDLAGKRLGIGAPGSGAHILSRALIEANNIAEPPTVLVEQTSENAGTDLLAGRLDAVFLMGDSAPIDTLRALMRDEGIRVYHFTQAEAYVRKFPFLDKIVLPQGAIDFGKNLPAQDVVTVGPTVELVARRGFNSALSDLLLQVASDDKIHGRASIFQKRGEFPAPLVRDFDLSDDALRYYKSGQGFAHKYIKQFWLASLVNRLLVAVVPLILVLIPAIRFFPLLYRWSVQLRIYRCYRTLLRFESDAQGPLDKERAQGLLDRLDEIERDVYKLKIPASFAYQFYALQGDVAFVRSRLRAAVAG